MFCLHLQRRLNNQQRSEGDQFDFESLSRVGNSKDTCLALVKKADLLGYRDFLVFRLCWYWIKSLGESPQKLCKAKLDNDLRIYYEKLLKLDRHDNNNKVRKLYNTISCPEALERSIYYSRPPKEVPVNSSFEICMCINQATCNPPGRTNGRDLTDAAAKPPISCCMHKCENVNPLIAQVKFKTHIKKNSSPDEGNFKPARVAVGVEPLLGRCEVSPGRSKIKLYHPQKDLNPIKITVKALEPGWAILQFSVHQGQDVLQTWRVPFKIVDAGPIPIREHHKMTDEVAQKSGLFSGEKYQRSLRSEEGAATEVASGSLQSYDIVEHTPSPVYTVTRSFPQVNYTHTQTSVLALDYTFTLTVLLAEASLIVTSSGVAVFADWDESAEPGSSVLFEKLEWWFTSFREPEPEDGRTLRDLTITLLLRGRALGTALLSWRALGTALSIFAPEQALMFKMVAPRLVRVEPPRTLLVGRLAKDRLGREPEPVMYPKRWIGEDKALPLGGRSWQPEEVSAEILRYLKEMAAEEWWFTSFREPEPEDGRTLRDLTITILLSGRALGTALLSWRALGTALSIFAPEQALMFEMVAPRLVRNVFFTRASELVTGWVDSLAERFRRDRSFLQERGQKTVIGIDFGTTYCAVATPQILKGKRVEKAEGISDVTLIKDDDDQGSIPSVVAVMPPHDTLLVGRRAKDRVGQKPEPVMYPKRWIGEDKALPLGDRRLQPEEVSAEILRYLKEMAADRIGKPIDGAVITIPAHFTERQEQKIVEACERAKLNVLGLLPDPVAAALAYGDARDPLTIMTYDLGGGAFEVAVVRKEDGVFAIKASRWDPKVSGCIFDERLAFWIVHWVNGGYQVDRQAPQWNELLALAETIKKTLSEKKYYRLNEGDLPNMRGKRGRGTLKITRETFEGLIKEDIEQTIHWCRQVLEEADLVPQSIDEIVLVGGCAHIPMVTRRLEAEFGRRPRLVGPESCVVVGAAIKARILVTPNS